MIRAVPLSDLTFTEDGNSDSLNNDPRVINFAKRELICEIISHEILLNQQQTYKFPVVEPVHTFLIELPSMNEQLLYRLSLQREPREVNTQKNL